MGPLVRTTGGLVRGTAGGVAGTTAFRGIPYAAPPLGPLRLRPPRPAPAWEGERDGSRAGAVAPQRPGPLERTFGGYGHLGEDCLTANVWSPAFGTAADTEGEGEGGSGGGNGAAVVDGTRPVLVWIHGGAFTTGTGAIAWYDGSRLAARGDVVVVTFNYRLGALGFLHLGDLGGEAWAGSGNTGLLDQVAALRWVRANAASFGGDPNRVTVFGESAGAMSIAALLAMPDASGLFQRAILQSGAGTFVQDRGTATALAADVLGELGIPQNDLWRLADVPLDDVLDAQTAAGGRKGGVGLAFLPVVDGATLPARPEAALAAGAAHDVPVLVGTNRDEMRLFSAVAPDAFAADDDDAVVRHVAAIPDVGAEAAPGIVAAYRRRWPDLSPTDLHVAIHTDHAFRRPAQRLATLQAGHARAWSYWFTWASPIFGGWLGSYHGLEIPFVFDNLAQPKVDLMTGGGDLQPLADAMADAWLAFARDGDPGWPPYEADGTRATMRFDLPPETIADPDPDLRRAWESIGL